MSLRVKTEKMEKWHVDKLKKSMANLIHAQRHDPASIFFYKLRLKV